MHKIHLIHYTVGGVIQDCWESDEWTTKWTGIIRQPIVENEPQNKLMLQERLEFRYCANKHMIRKWSSLETYYPVV